MENSPIEKKYSKWIIILSIFIPVAVAFLFVVKLKDLGIDAPTLPFLPPIYAAINGITAVVLVIAVWAIKNGKIRLHQNLMKTAIGCSLLFLVMYIAYHMTTPSTKFGGDGVIKYLYFFILITHILLSIAISTLLWFDLSNRFVWIEAFRAHINAIHNRMATEQAIRIF